MLENKKNGLSNQKDVIENIKSFIEKNTLKLQEQYFSVIDRQLLPKKLAANNDIYVEISEYDYKTELLKVSVVVFSANFFECEILNYNAFKESNEKIKKLKNGIDIFLGKDFRLIDAFIFEINGLTILHLKAPETGSNTPCGSADLARYVCNIKFLNPACIISFGICYGIDYKKQSLGDVLLAEKIYPWSIGIKVKDDDWSIKHDDYIIDLRQNAKTLYYKINEVFKGKTNKCKNVLFGNVSSGNIITSEAVVNNEKVKIAAIEKSYGCNIIGGEMEGYGLAKECIYYGNVPCLIIKAICDWGVCKNIDDILDDNLSNEARFDCKGQIQAYAAYCAYLALKKLFFENVFEEKSFFENVKKHIYNTYYNDGYIQDDCLKKSIVDFVGKNTNGICDDKMCNQLISLFESSNVLKKVVDTKIVGYAFV